MDSVPTYYRTGDVACPNRFAYWREAVCDAYVKLECETNDPSSFSGEIELRRGPRLSTSIVSGAQQTVRRRKSDISRSTDAFFIVSLQLEKSGLVEQGGRVAALNAGDLAVYSSIETYKLTLPGAFRQLVFQIPRTDLLQRIPNADLLTALRVPGERDLGRFASGSLMQLIGTVERGGDLARQLMQETIVDLVATGLASVAGESAVLSSSERQVVMRADAFVRRNISDPDLNRETLAAHLGLSVRRLNQIFNAQGTSISAAIRNARLERIAADLLDPRFSSSSITEIAVRRGINNLQHFSKMFRDRYGLPPRDYRRSGGSHEGV